jgi:hypothetical protein
MCGENDCIFILRGRGQEAEKPLARITDHAMKCLIRIIDDLTDSFN